MNINAPNFGGLGLAAGNTNLNLTVPGALGLQAAQIAGTQKNAMLDRQQQAFLQMRQQNLLRNQMAQQAYQAQQGNLTDQQRLALEQQKLAQQGMTDAGTADFRERQLAQQGELGRGDIDVRKAAVEQDKMAKQMQALIEMDKKKLREAGAFASYGLIALNGAKTPEEANMIRKEILKEAVAKGYRSKEEAAELLKMPISQSKAAFARAVIASGQASEFQAANKSMNPPDKSGIQATFEDGQLTSLSVDPNTAVKSEVQKKVLSEEALQRRFSQIEKDFDPNYFRYGNKMDVGASNLADMLKDTKLGKISDTAATAFTGMPAEKRDEFISKRTTFMNDVNQVFNQYRKEITGAAAAMQELDRLQSSFLSGEMAPSEFRGALELVKSRGLQEIEQNKQVLREGVNIRPSYSREEILAEMQRRGLK